MAEQIPGTLSVEQAAILDLLDRLTATQLELDQVKLQASAMEARLTRLELQARGDRRRDSARRACQHGKSAAGANSRCSTATEVQK
ncbi:hypothetical protein [Frigidibacter oleivorans]|uniref:hypothetical protein n=1 Tax=Frigidibacter oleivorans TaxID=2487129 RepID=UPI000F8F316D|nr:hypothetical protein [Frigidibacter oleivorans]